MAGIGFEIKKIYDKNSITNKVTGLAYTSFVSIGPTIICIVMLLAVSEITEFYGVDFMTRETLNSAIMYAFLFSLLFVSGTSMVLSRYLSDAIYNEKLKSVFSSLIGIVTLTTLVSGSVGLIFYYFSPLDFIFKLLSYITYMELSIIFVFMVYVSAIKDYKKVSIAFLLGFFLTVISSLIMIHYLGVSVVYAILVGINLGFLLNILIILRTIGLIFDSDEKRYYEFLVYIEELPKLFFINTFYTLGLFSHNFMFWFFSDLSIVVADTFISAPVYDRATFYSVLTILPAAVFFVLKVETSFYIKYKSFLMTIVNGGSLNDLKKSKRSMIFLIQEEMAFIMEIQLLISILSIVVLTQLVFPFFGVSPVVGELFTYLALGYYSAFMAFLLTTVLLYFNAQKEALIVQSFFVFSNTVFSYITILLGKNYHGLGMAISGTMTLMIALYLFRYVINNVDYMLFCQQPLINTRKESNLRKLMTKAYGEEIIDAK